MYTHQIPCLITAVENANNELLLNLIQKAQVSVGHIRGRLISVPDYNGFITFSQFHDRIEKIYQRALKPMYDRYNQYKRDILQI